MQSQITDFALVSWFKKDTIDSNRGNKEDRGYLNNLDQESIGALIVTSRRLYDVFSFLLFVYVPTHIDVAGLSDSTP